MLFLLLFLSLFFFFSMSVFPSKEIYHFTTVGQEKLSSYLSVPYNFLPTLRNATVSLDYHPNIEISYLEVVSLPPLKPASLVIVSNSLPCSRRCWSWTELMSWPEIFPQAESRLRDSSFWKPWPSKSAFCNICRTKSLVSVEIPGFLALRVIESSNSVSPAEIRLKKKSYSPVAEDLNNEEVFALRQVDSPRAGRKIIRPIQEEKKFKAIGKQFLFVWARKKWYVKLNGKKLQTRTDFKYISKRKWTLHSFSRFCNRRSCICRAWLEQLGERRVL